MQTADQLLDTLNDYLSKIDLSSQPATLYQPINYFLAMGGKRIRPILCLMANELFGQRSPDAIKMAAAIELFHNFTLAHDDIMDKAPLRRRLPTLHEKYGQHTAILAGDAMLIKAYQQLQGINSPQLSALLRLFNTTALQVCEGQQMDMDMETAPYVDFDTYLTMITLKTSVLLAASLALGAMVNQCSPADANHLYEYGKNLGIAFQIQDDYLDAFGQIQCVGKQIGGDILANKKTFLLIRSLEVCKGTRLEQLTTLLASNPPDKVTQMLAIYDHCEVGNWALHLQNKYYTEARYWLDQLAVPAQNKIKLQALGEYLMNRTQ